MKKNLFICYCLLTVILMLPSYLQAGTKSCDHYTRQIDRCIGNMFDFAGDKKDACEKACYNKDGVGDGVYEKILSIDLTKIPPPEYLIPPPASEEDSVLEPMASGANTHYLKWVANFSGQTYNVGLSNETSQLASPAYHPDYGDGWYALYIPVSDTDPTNDIEQYAGDISQFPAARLLDANGTPYMLPNGTAVSGASLGDPGDIDETIVGQYLSTMATLGIASPYFTDANYRLCVLNCGSLIRPFSEATTLYPLNNFYSFTLSTDDNGEEYYIYDPATPPDVMTLPRTEVPYQSCWKDCLREIVCEAPAVGVCDPDNPDTSLYCSELCLELAELRYDGAYPGFATTYCPTKCDQLINNVPDSSCSSYWTPQTHLVAKVGAGGCGKLRRKKTRRHNFLINWQQGDKAASFEATTRDGKQRSRKYMAGIDVTGTNGASICVYDAGSAFIIKDAEKDIEDLIAKSKLGITDDNQRVGGRGDGVIPVALDEDYTETVKTIGGLDVIRADERVFVDNDDVSHRLCYQVPLPNGPKPCCPTLMKALVTPVVVDISYSQWKKRPESVNTNPLYSDLLPARFSTFLQPMIRISFSGVIHNTSEPDPLKQYDVFLDLEYNFSSNPKIGNGVVRSVSDVRITGGGAARNFIAKMDDTDKICAYEQLIIGGKSIEKSLGCVPRDMRVPRDEYRFKFYSDYPTPPYITPPADYRSAAMIMYMHKQVLDIDPTTGRFIYTPLDNTLSNYNSVIMRKGGLSTTCALLYNYEFCISDQARTKELDSFNVMQTVPDISEHNRILCINNMPDNVTGALIARPESYKDLADNRNMSFPNPQNIALGLCTMQPPLPCGYGDPLAPLFSEPDGYAQWGVHALTGSLDYSWAMAVVSSDYEVAGEPAWSDFRCPSGMTKNSDSPIENIPNTFVPPASYNLTVGADDNLQTHSDGEAFDSEGWPFRKCIRLKDGTADWARTDAFNPGDEPGTGPYIIHSPCETRICPEAIATPSTNVEARLKMDITDGSLFSASRYIFPNVDGYDLDAVHTASMYNAAAHASLPTSEDPLPAPDNDPASPDRICVNVTFEIQDCAPDENLTGCAPTYPNPASYCNHLGEWQYLPPAEHGTGICKRKGCEPIYMHGDLVSFPGNAAFTAFDNGTVFSAEVGTSAEGVCAGPDYYPKYKIDATTYSHITNKFDVGRTPQLECKLNPADDYEAVWDFSTYTGIINTGDPQIYEMLGAGTNLATSSPYTATILASSGDGDIKCLPGCSSAPVGLAEFPMSSGTPSPGTNVEGRCITDHSLTPKPSADCTVNTLPTPTSLGTTSWENILTGSCGCALDSGGTVNITFPHQKYQFYAINNPLPPNMREIERAIGFDVSLRNTGAKGVAPGEYVYARCEPTTNLKGFVRVQCKNVGGNSSFPEYLGEDLVADEVEHNCRWKPPRAWLFITDRNNNTNHVINTIGPDGPREAIQPNHSAGTGYKEYYDETTQSHPFRNLADNLPAWDQLRACNDCDLKAKLLRHPDSQNAALFFYEDPDFQGTEQMHKFNDHRYANSYPMQVLPDWGGNWFQLMSGATHLPSHIVNMGISSLRVCHFDHYKDVEDAATQTHYDTRGVFINTHACNINKLAPVTNWSPWSLQAGPGNPPTYANCDIFDPSSGCIY